MDTRPEDFASVSKLRGSENEVAPEKTGQESGEGTEVTTGTGHAHDETAH
jgi:hypothetical protein